MPTANKIEVNISGDNYGNIIIGDNNIVGTPDGIKINKTKAQSKFERRTKPINLRPRAFAGLLGRVNELQIIRNAITNNLPVTLFGENGIGKTSLIRQATHLSENKNFEDGVIYLTARNEERDDLLQQLFDSIYASTPNHKPTDAQIRSDLKNIHALIFLDDLTLKREDVAYLLDAMPKSLFILASDERALWGEGQVIGLDGLPENEALQLFERELGRNLKDDERPTAIQICKILLFHPLRILQAASLMREEGQSIQQVFTSLTKTQTQSAPLEVTLQKSNETQKKILSLLAVAGGFALTREHLARLAGAKTFDVDINSLVAKGLVENQGATFSLSGESVKSLVRLWDLSGWEDTLINHFSTWLQTAPQDTLIDQVANTLFYLIQRAGEKKQWNNVVVIGKRLEQFYALKKKWDGWLKILKLIQLAAKYLKDQYLEGWVTHQLGSRALCLDLKTEASELLNQALKIRKAIGDKGGLQVTQHNLDVLMNVPIPTRMPNPKMSNFQKMLIFGGVGGTVVVAFLLLSVGVYIFMPAPTALPTSTIILPPTDDPTLTSLPPTRVPTVTRATPTRVPTGTPIPKPIVLYDFVLQANQADWYLEIAEQETYPLYPPFYENEIEEDALYNIMEYPADYGQPYVGWSNDGTPPLEDGSYDDLVLLSFSAPNNGPTNAIIGSYDSTKIILRSGDHFYVRIGHVTLPDSFSDPEFDPAGDIGFQIFFSEFPTGSDSDISIVSGDVTKNIYVLGGQTMIIDSLDGIIREYDFAIPSTLFGKSGYFILKVLSGSLEGNDWGVWLDAELIGLPR